MFASAHMLEVAMLALCIFEIKNRSSSVRLHSGDTDGLRASERDDAVEHADTPGHLGGPRPAFARPRTVSRQHLEAMHQGVDQRALVIAAGDFPFAPPVLLDDNYGLVTPGCARRTFGPRHRSIAWWNRGLCASRGNLRMARLDVVSAVASDDIDRRISRDLIEQVGQHFTIANALVGYQCDPDLALVRLKGDIDLAPSPGLVPTGLANFPLALARKLQPSAIDHRMQRLSGTRGGRHDVQILRAAAQCRVVRHWQRWEGQSAQTLHAAMQRTQRKVENPLETEQTLNQRIRIDEWVATRERLGFSRWHEQALFDPHRHVSSDYQPLVVLRAEPNAIYLRGLGALSIVLAHRPEKVRDVTPLRQKLADPALQPLRINVSPTDYGFMRQIRLALDLITLRAIPCSELSFSPLPQTVIVAIGKNRFAAIGHFIQLWSSSQSLCFLVLHPRHRARPQMATSSQNGTIEHYQPFTTPECKILAKWPMH